MRWNGFQCRRVDGETESSRTSSTVSHLSFLSPRLFLETLAVSFCSLRVVDRCFYGGSRAIRLIEAEKMGRCIGCMIYSTICVRVSLLLTFKKKSREAESQRGKYVLQIVSATSFAARASPLYSSSAMAWGENGCFALSYPARASASVLAGSSITASSSSPPAFQLIRSRCVTVKLYKWQSEQCILDGIIQQVYIYIYRYLHR